MANKRRDLWGNGRNIKERKKEIEKLCFQTLQTQCYLASMEIGIHIPQSIYCFQFIYIYI